MIVFNQCIPSSHLVKEAQVIPEQSMLDIVNLYEDAIPYIRCQIQSTIQHEAAHRADEEGRNEELLKQKQGYPFTDLARAAQILPFDRFVDENRAEPIAEREEEDCDVLLPAEISGQVAQINLNQLFEEAKNAANIDANYKQDVRAGHLPPDAQGLYLMQDRSNTSAEDLVKIKESRGNAHLDEQNNLWVDVRKIATPFIVQEQPQQPQPATHQGPGDGAVQPDLPGVSQAAPTMNAAPAAEGSPTVPGREAR